MSDEEKIEGLSPQVDISTDDIYEAMQQVTGYLDITPSDFREIYRFAFRHALERITHSIRARDIMTKPALSVTLDTTLAKVAEIMSEKGVSGVPVVGYDQRVAGVISEKDFLTRMGVRNKRHFMGVISECLTCKECVIMTIRAKTAEEIMSSPPTTVTEDATVSEISRLFTEKKINRVPVVDDGGALTGIVSRADIVRALYGRAAG